MAEGYYSICCTQRIVLYETKARYYLVGSNNAETRFRVLKIDRTEPYQLVVSDDQVQYTKRQIKDLLSMINAGNMSTRSKAYDNSSKGLHRSISAYGMLGFIRFLEGYYIILITRRRKEAQIGGHTIYKVEDTRMVPIPNETVRQKIQHSDESKYVKIFQNVDLSSNFYFSYSYDLTHNLQHNMASLIHMPSPSNSATYATCERCAGEVKSKDGRKQIDDEAKSILTTSSAGVNKGKIITTKERGGITELSKDRDYEKGGSKVDVTKQGVRDTLGQQRRGRKEGNVGRTEETRGNVDQERDSCGTKSSDDKEGGRNSILYELEDETPNKIKLAGNIGEPQTSEQNNSPASPSGASLSENSQRSETLRQPETSKDCENRQETSSENTQSDNGPDISRVFVCGDCVKLREERTKQSFRQSQSCGKFVWNEYLLQEFTGSVNSDWVLHIVNGFVGQSDICVYGKPVYVTLIARRSKNFAGTRFLKRGANDEGDVANEVETEQIVHDASVLSCMCGRFTSHVQLRGSVPAYWSQDVKQMMVPKPQICVDRADPYCTTAAQHFNQLLARFGAPLVILNLVKKRERKPHEQILSEELRSAVTYLNQFLPQQHAIQYIAWDMASKDFNVIEKLEIIADQVFKSTGFFHSGPELYCNQLRRDPRWIGMGGTDYVDHRPGREQNGVLRTNCVDCLDRTNTAQFMVGKCALGYQLQALGVIEKPTVKFDSDAVRILEDLYEAHGDTLSLQYGGSQLVHGIRTYRKVSPFTSHSRDIMQTVSRYYSNAFTDADKQQAINLFLGVFIPSEKKRKIWEVPNDYYLHNPTTRDIEALRKHRSYTKWWDSEVVEALPHPTWEFLCMTGKGLDDKPEEEEQPRCRSQSVDEQIVDIFSEYYRPHELSVFEVLHPSLVQKSCRDFMPPHADNHSPFVVRAPTKSVGAAPSRKAIGATPGVPADDSTDDDTSSDDLSVMTSSPEKSCTTTTATVSFEDRLPSMREVYGMGLSEPKGGSVTKYNRFVEFDKTAEVDRNSKVVKHYKCNWEKHRLFTHDTAKNVKPPSVNNLSAMIYSSYVEMGKSGYVRPSATSVEAYHRYVSKNYQ